jgi:hypothetical protein
MLTQPRLIQRQMRTLAEILEYDFKIDYLPGARNYIQDALSRRPGYKEPLILPYTIPVAANQVKSVMFLELDKKDKWFDRIWIGYTEDPYHKDILHMFEKGLDQNLLKQEL